jgi:integrase
VLIAIFPEKAGRNDRFCWCSRCKFEGLREAAGIVQFRPGKSRHFSEPGRWVISVVTGFSEKTMGRPKGSRSLTPSYRRHTSGQAVVTLAGKDHYLGKHGSAASRAKYERLIGEYLMAGRSLPKPIDAGGESITMNELIAMYVTHRSKAGDAARRGEIVRWRTVGAIVRRLYGTMPISEFGPLTFRALVNEFIATEVHWKGEHKGHKWSRATVNAAMLMVKMMFDWAVANELARPSQAHALRTVKKLRKGEGARDTKKIEPPAEEDIEAVLAIATPQLRAMIRLQWLTGMRAGELVQMKPISIDMSDPQVWVFRPEHHKTSRFGHVRQIPLGPKCQALIEPYRPQNIQEHYWKPATAYVEAVERTKSRSRPISDRERAKRQNKPRRLAQIRRGNRPMAFTRNCYSSKGYSQSVYNLVKRAARIAKKEGRPFERWHSHQLRHAAGTRFRAQFGADATQALLGHADISSTERYAPPDASKALRAMVLVG